MCERNVLSGSRALSIPTSEASVLIVLTTKSAKMLVVEPPATEGLGLCSVAIHDVSHDSLFTNCGLVRLAKESNCTETDCGSHVKRVLTLSDVLILTLAFFFLGAQRDVEDEGKDKTRQDKRR